MSQLNPFADVPSAEPYRAGLGGHTASNACDRAEAPVWAAVVLFWMVSAIRVLGAMAGHEVFGAEATLALMVAVGTPWAVALGYRSRAGCSPGGAGSASR